MPHGKSKFIPAVNKLILMEASLLKPVIQYSEDKIQPLKSSPELASESMSWIHEPQDPATRAAINTVTAITLRSGSIQCRVRFESQILAARKVLAFASHVQQSPGALIWSLQAETDTRVHREHSEIERVLQQACKRNKSVKVFWRDATTGFGHLRGNGQSFLVYRVLWSQIRLISQHFLQWLYQEVVLIPYLSLSWIVFVALFFGAFILGVYYLGGWDSM